MFLFGLILGFILGGAIVALVFRKHVVKAKSIMDDLVAKVKTSTAIISKSEIENLIEKHK